MNDLDFVHKRGLDVDIIHRDRSAASSLHVDAVYEIWMLPREIEKDNVRNIKGLNAHIF